MAKNNNVQEHSHWPFYRRHWFFRALFWGAILALVVGAFVTGVCIGFIKSTGADKFTQFRMGINKSFILGGHGGKNVMVWRDFGGTDEMGVKYVFGAITKIEGPKITVVDNGGKEQVILSESATRIISGGYEIPLGDLESGEAIGVWGTTGLTGLDAKMIQVMSGGSAASKE